MKMINIKLKQKLTREKMKKKKIKSNKILNEIRREKNILSSS